MAPRRLHDRSQPRPCGWPASALSSGQPRGVGGGHARPQRVPFRASATRPDAITAAVGSLHRYPDPTATRLREQLADLHDVDPEYLLVGNGWDELIYLLTGAFAAGGSIVCADPAYQLDVSTAQVAHAEVHQVPLADWHHDLSAMAAVEADLAYVVNPHNPTGTAHPLGATPRSPSTVTPIWPGHERYHENLMTLGEDAYSGGPVEMRKSSDEELPADYRALL